MRNNAPPPPATGPHHQKPSQLVASTPLPAAHRFPSWLQHTVSSSPRSRRNTTTSSPVSRVHTVTRCSSANATLLPFGQNAILLLYSSQSPRNSWSRPVTRFRQVIPP